MTYSSEQMLKILQTGSCLYNILATNFIMILNWRKSATVMVLNTTFNNISAMSWQSVLLVEEIGVSRENHRPAASH
jgi:hypothetical protein